jgi:hypothetical protein
MHQHNNHKGRVRFLTALVALPLVCAPSGCSYLFVRPPPPQVDRAAQEDYEAPCTRRRVAPVLDTIAGALAGGYGALFLLIGSAERSSENRRAVPSWEPIKDHSSSNTFLTLGVGALALGITEAFSAGYGYTTTRECREIYPIAPKRPKLKAWAPDARWNEWPRTPRP